MNGGSHGWQLFLVYSERGKNMSELRVEYKNMQAADLGEESCVPDLLEKGFYRIH